MGCFFFEDHFLFIISVWKPAEDQDGKTECNMGETVKAAQTDPLYSFQRPSSAIRCERHSAFVPCYYGRRRWSKASKGEWLTKQFFFLGRYLSKWTGLYNHSISRFLITNLCTNPVQSYTPPDKLMLKKLNVFRYKWLQILNNYLSVKGEKKEC